MTALRSTDCDLIAGHFMLAPGNDWTLQASNLGEALEGLLVGRRVARVRADVIVAAGRPQEPVLTLDFWVEKESARG